MKNLTQLRKNQRVDKNRSGRKQPRKFDLIQVQDLYNQEESEDIQIGLATSQPLLPRSSVDDVIDSVVAEAHQSAPAEPSSVPLHEDPVVVNNLDEKLWCVCRTASSGEMIACDNSNCKIEWFHFSCLDITRAPRGNWYCLNCKPRDNIQTKRKLDFVDGNETKKPKIQKTKCPDCSSLLAKSYIKTHLKKFCLANK